MKTDIILAGVGGQGILSIAAALGSDDTSVVPHEQKQNNILRHKISANNFFIFLFPFENLFFMMLLYFIMIKL